MNKSLYLVVILLFLLSSCEPFNRKNESSLNLSSSVQKVIAGTDSTSKLAVLRDKEIPPAANPNSIKVDTFITSRKKYYAVLAEYPDPLYNRFVITDADYNVLLMDKSLNGNLSEFTVKVGQNFYIQVEENFISKGVLGLKRTSLYSIDDKAKAELAFRTYTELSESGITYKQDILKIEPWSILTKIYSTGQEESKLKQDSEVFLFNKITGEYYSEENKFDSFVFSEVNNFDSMTDKPQIISRRSYLRQLGINSSEKTTEHKVGSFSMPLSDEWNEVKNVKISAPLKNPMNGTKYINNHYGAEISVIKIPANDSSESLINYPLENISSGNYRVRFSDKISAGKYFYQFFEYSCRSEKFLLILQTIKTTYDLYKSDYQNLINSFSMEC